MALELEEDTIHKQTIDIEDLKTQSVTLYPSRASIVRDIEGVIIKPGRNEITILGLSIHVDENTIKVEGHGIDALITDTVVEEVSRKYEVPKDIEPEMGEDEKLQLEKIKEEIEEIKQEIEDGEEVLKSCSSQISYLEQHILNLSALSAGKPTSADTTTNAMTLNLQSYAEFRAKVYKDYKAAQIRLKGLRVEIFRKRSTESKIHKDWNDSQKKVRAEKLKKREPRKERPTWVRQITVTVESNSLPKDTQSIVSTISTGRPARAEDDEPPAKSNGPSLRISYITTRASWKPRYDLQLDTTSETGVLTYRAESLNTTGETWRDAKITLSTSQTSFTGLEDKVPWMDSWRLNLCKSGGQGVGEAALYSKNEKEIGEARSARQKRKFYPLLSKKIPPTSPSYSPSSPTQAPIVQSTTFWVPEAQKSFGGPFGAAGFGHATVPTNSNTENNISKPFTAGLFGNAPTGNTGPDLFGNAPTGSTSTGLFGRAQAINDRHRQRLAALNNEDPSCPVVSDCVDGSDCESDSGTLNLLEKMSLALSNSESYGLTTTYDLPGARTIPSSDVSRRHVITEISLADIEFSHIAVPKLRVAAFLRAKIKNSSSTHLLEGPVGLTLDGSFLGNSTIMRCAPDARFELGLGIDPEVLIEYRKPVHKMASQGMLVKEQVVTYERGIRLYNARSKAIKLLLFDQVPISEDEKLKISILSPRGLRNVGDVVKISGTVPESSASSAKSSFLAKKDTEGIQVELKKGGELRYQILLEKGKEVFLPLEYEARLPAGEAISVV